MCTTSCARPAASPADRLRDLEAGRLEERGGEVAHVDEVVDDPARLDAAAPADRQREVEPRLVDLPLHAGEGHAVVGRDEDQSVVELARLLQPVEDPAEVAVEPLDLEGVIEHVAADG